MTWDQVDRILLVGGSTHMPMTGAMLRELSGKPPDNSLAVSEVVARGAAIHAGIVAARAGQASASSSAGAASALADVVEINVNAHSLGIEVRKDEDRVNDILIPKNTQLPAAASRVYRTVAENQQRVRVKVLQGEAQPGGRVHPHRRVLDRRAAAGTCRRARRSRSAAACGATA